MNHPPREVLRRLFDAAVSAAHPDACLPPHLPPPPGGRLIVLAAGKAAGAMASAAERHYLDDLGLDPARLTGLAVTRYGYAAHTRAIRVLEASHPVPDEAGVAATRETLALAGQAGPDDLVLVLLSGGGSALWIAPAPGVDLQAKQALTRELLRCGATIGEINTVRRHLSRIKGGRLATAVWPARLMTLAISDVPGDDPETIASGPTVGDPTTLEEARAVLDRFSIRPAPEIAAALDDASSETPAPDDERLSRADFRLVATPSSALDAVAREAASMGFDTVMLGSDLEGEARDIAADHADRARALAGAGRRAAILSGGEATVTLHGDGRGGPNQEFALALAIALDGHAGICGLAADTDGTDGGAGNADDPAGAIVLPDTLARARTAGVDPRAALARNDSTGFFEAIGDLLPTGPTFTNVNDLRVVLVDTAGPDEQG